MLIDLLMMVLAFAAGTVVAEAFGADNLGIALSFGQLSFTAVLVWVLLRRG
jgi:hypothetical protein